MGINYSNVTLPKIFLKFIQSCERFGLAFISGSAAAYQSKTAQIKRAGTGLLSLVDASAWLAKY